MKTNKIISVLLAGIIIVTVSSCQKKQNASKDTKEKNLNIYVDIKDKNTLNIIKFLTDEYKKDNPQSKLKINDVLGGGNSVIEDIGKGTEADLIFTSRNTMIELSQKGIISDMSQYYERNKTGDKYYNITSAYSRVGDKYYGIGILPYTLEIFYNSDAVNKLGITPPLNIMNMAPVIKKLSSNGTRIPVILGDDLDINTALSSIAAANRIKITKLDEAYDNKKAYKDMKDMQAIFDDINTAAKQIGITKNSFELGNESTLSSLADGSIPIAIATSYYFNNIKDSKIAAVEDYSIGNNAKGNVPVIINSVLCLPANTKNQEEAGKFIKFVVDDSTQEKLTKQGYVTSNKKANEKLQGLGLIISKHLQTANDNSILYIYSLPKKFQSVIAARIDSILSGKYTGNEWEEIVDQIYK